MSEPIAPRPTRRGFFGVVGAIAAVFALKPFKVLDVCIPSAVEAAPVAQAVSAGVIRRNPCIWLGGAGDGEWFNAANWKDGVIARTYQELRYPPEQEAVWAALLARRNAAIIPEKHEREIVSLT